MQIIKLLRNRFISFTVTRYFIYLLKFIQGIYVAAILGPVYFGLWGFITMFIEYLKLSSLGNQYSINIELSTIEKGEGQNNDVIGRLISSSLLVTILLSIIVVLPIFVFFHFDIFVFSEYDISNYLLVILTFTILNNISLIFTNIYRSYTNLTRIIISELIFGILPFLCIFIYTGTSLIYAMLQAMLIARFINIIMFSVKFPYPINFTFDFVLIKRIVYVGFGLLIYNLSYNLAFLSARTTISIFYSIKEMGYFSLAYTITSASLLGLNALTYAVYPKILYKLREEGDNGMSYSFLKKATKLYSIIITIIVLFMILIAPLVFYFLPAYSDVTETLNILLLAQALYSYSMIHASVSFARKKQYSVAFFNLVLLGGFVLVSLLLGYLKVSFNIISLALLSYILIYSIWQIRFANKLFLKKYSYLDAIKEMFPLRLFLPILFVLVVNFIGFSAWSGFSFFLFFGLNYQNIKVTAEELLKLVSKKK